MRLTSKEVPTDQNTADFRRRGDSVADGLDVRGYDCGVW